MREQRQQEAVEAYLASDGRSIINAAPRFGKIKVALDICKALKIEHIWIIAPRNDIFVGWDEDMEKFGGPTVVGKTTFASIKNLSTGVHPKLIIIDEPHELSVNQQNTLAEKIKELGNPRILGLTGTMTDKTAEQLFDSLNLDTCYKFSIQQAVDDGILADYDITIHRVPLENSEFRFSTKGKKYTEKGFFDLQTYLRKEARTNKFFFDLKLINIIQNSRAKQAKTIQLLEQSKNERILVFCGTTEIADNLGIPVYHSKAKEKEVFNSFCKGIKYDQLATIKMMQAGITITPIHKGIINYTSGNPEDCAQKICRFLGFEYANPQKKAEIHIISSDENFEAIRLKTALLFFNQSKIKTCV